MNIRPAAVSDAPGIARVHVHSWQAAYRGIVPESILNSMSIAQRESVWREAIATGAPELWVADLESDIIGWAAFGPSRDSDAAPLTGELEAIYVQPSSWHQGVGRALWIRVRDRLAERGFQSVTLWVLADNSRAISFYRFAGFTEDPASRREILRAGRALQEVRYTLPLRTL